MLTCPMCKKEVAEHALTCPRCRADLSILVDYVSHLQGGLVREIPDHEAIAPAVGAGQAALIVGRE